MVKKKNLLNLPDKKEKRKRGRPSTASKAKSFIKTPIIQDNKLQSNNISQSVLFNSSLSPSSNKFGMMMPMMSMMPMMLPISSSESPDTLESKRKRGRPSKKDNQLLSMWPFGLPIGIRSPPTSSFSSAPVLNGETKTSPASKKNLSPVVSRPRGRPRSRPRPGESLARPKQLPLAPAQPFIYSLPSSFPFSQVNESAKQEENPPPPLESTDNSPNRNNTNTKNEKSSPSKIGKSSPNKSPSRKGKFSPNQFVLKTRKEFSKKPQAKSNSEKASISRIPIRKSASSSPSKISSKSYIKRERISNSRSPIRKSVSSSPIISGKRTGPKSKK